VVCAAGSARAEEGAACGWWRVLAFGAAVAASGCTPTAEPLDFLSAGAA
jgi:hypothetical protein